MLRVRSQKADKKKNQVQSKKLFSELENEAKMLSDHQTLHSQLLQKQDLRFSHFSEISHDKAARHQMLRITNHLHQKQEKSSKEKNMISYFSETFKKMKQIKVG